MLIDAQPRGGNRQTAKRLCKVVHLQFVLLNFFKAFLSVETRPQPSWGLPRDHSVRTLSVKIDWMLPFCYVYNI